MDSKTLTNFYDQLKAKLNDSNSDQNTTTNIRVGGGPIGGTMEHPGVLMYRRKAAIEGDKLREDCRKHILLDIYCKILPLDDDYKCGHVGQMKSDIDNMLQGKNMTATQYLTSCFEATEAPLVEYILRSTDMIRDQFMKEANEKLADAIEQDISVPEPKAPDVESEDVNGQLVDIQKDTEYDTFIDKLKQKTVNKIVSDVSKIINDKKEEKNMTFDTTPAEELKKESAFGICLNYVEGKLMKEGIELNESLQDEMIGMAIRESVLNEIDHVFSLTESDITRFSTRIRLGKGFICNESAINYFNEAVNK